MEIRFVTDPALGSDTDLLVACVHGAPEKDAFFKAVDELLGGAARATAKREAFRGEDGQSILLHGGSAAKANHIVFLGAGGKSEFAAATTRDLCARAVALGDTKGAVRMTFVMPHASGKQLEHAIQFAAEGAILGQYAFDKYRSEKSKKTRSVTRLSLMAEGGKGGKQRAPDTRAARAAIKRAQSVAAATCRARNYVNEPAEFMTPERLAKEARALAKTHPSIKVKVHTARECEKLGMGMFLAVGRGSALEPRLIHLTYSPAQKPKKRVVLIGKGVTFDSGGYSLKPSASMLDMKIDMAGSAAVIAAMGAIAELGSAAEVHAVAACCENMVSGGAYRLGDVLTSMSGTTVEINNTDAEGRLTLGDAITYARTKIEPDEMFDFATLTGACVVALGDHTAGVMSADETLVGSWLGAAARSGEDMWRLPLTSKLREQLKSNVADLRNTGERWGGAITAGLFLQHFAKDTPWVHVDIAGPASASRQQGATAQGGTGFAVATIVEYLTR